MEPNRAPLTLMGGTFAINSLGHVSGTRCFETTDQFPRAWERLLAAAKG